MSALEFRNLLEAGDVNALWKAWARVAPHLPQPEKRAQAEIVMHRARTQAESVTFQKRAFSHRWLEERGIPSSLPDHMRPSAERMYPRIVTAVGIICGGGNPSSMLIRSAMEQAVLEAYGDNRTEPEFVRKRMQAARLAEKKRLFGSIDYTPPKKKAA